MELVERKTRWSYVCCLLTTMNEVTDAYDCEKGSLSHAVKSSEYIYVDLFVFARELAPTLFSVEYWLPAFISLSTQAAHYLNKLKVRAPFQEEGQRNHPR